MEFKHRNEFILAYHTQNTVYAIGNWNLQKLGVWMALKSDSSKIVRLRNDGQHGDIFPDNEVWAKKLDPEFDITDWTAYYVTDGVQTADIKPYALI